MTEATKDALVKRLRDLAEKISAANINGFGNECAFIADELAAHLSEPVAERDALVKKLQKAVNTSKDDLEPALLLNARMCKEYITALSAGEQEAVAWMWQHDETGAKGFVENASKEDLAQWERINKPRRLIYPLYTTPPNPKEPTMTDRELLREVQSVMYHADGCAYWRHNPCSCGVLAIKKRITARLSEPEDVVTVPKEPTEKNGIALNTMHPLAERAADAFWKYWRENGETHKHGYYESTWGAINKAIQVVGVVRHDYETPRAMLDAAQKKGQP